MDNNEQIQCIGTIEAILGKNAIVKTNKKEICDKCKKCDYKFDSKNKSVIAKNLVNAQTGDTVHFVYKESKLEFLIKMVYFAPVIFLLAGFLLSLRYSNEIYQLIFASSMFLVGIILTIIIIALLKYFTKVKFFVTEIVSKFQDKIEETKEEKVIEQEINNSEIIEESVSDGSN